MRINITRRICASQCQPYRWITYLDTHPTCLEPGCRFQPSTKRRQQARRYALSRLHASRRLRASDRLLQVVAAAFVISKLGNPKTKRTPGMLGEFFMLQFHRISFINTCALSFSNTHAHAQTPVFMHSRTLTCTHRHAHYTPSSCKAVPYTCHPDLGKSALQNDQVRTCDTRCMSHHTSHVTRHTSHVTRHTSHVTRHTSPVTRHTSHVTRHTSHVTSCRCNNRNPSIPNILRRSRAWVRVLPFPSLSARHTPHPAPPSSRDTRRTQVCPATRAKHPKWWPSSTISLQTFTSAFARVLPAACVVCFSCHAARLHYYIFSHLIQVRMGRVFSFCSREERGKVCCKIVLPMHAMHCLPLNAAAAAFFPLFLPPHPCPATPLAFVDTTSALLTPSK